MPKKDALYQCKACGAVIMARERRAHLNERHQHAADTLATTQVNACFTTTIDIYHPGRAEKWGYTDEEISSIIPGLEPISGEEVNDA